MLIGSAGILVAILAGLVVYYSTLEVQENFQGFP
jgi:Ca2+/Na+ antiporter